MKGWGALDRAAVPDRVDRTTARQMRASRGRARGSGRAHLVEWPTPAHVHTRRGGVCHHSTWALTPAPPSVGLAGAPRVACVPAPCSFWALARHLRRRGGTGEQSALFSFFDSVAATRPRARWWFERTRVYHEKFEQPRPAHATQPAPSRAPRTLRNVLTCTPRVDAPAALDPVGQRA